MLRSKLNERVQFDSANQHAVHVTGNKEKTRFTIFIEENGAICSLIHINDQDNPPKTVSLLSSEARSTFKNRQHDQYFYSTTIPKNKLQRFQSTVQATYFGTVEETVNKIFVDFTKAEINPASTLTTVLDHPIRISTNGAEYLDWAKKWDTLTGNKADKIIELLKKFYLCKKNIEGLFHTHRHHNEQIDSALNALKLFDQISEEAEKIAGKVIKEEDKEKARINHLLRLIQAHIENNEIVLNGDLSIILELINEKTGFNYYNLPSESVPAPEINSVEIYGDGTETPEDHLARLKELYQTNPNPKLEAPIKNLEEAIKAEQQLATPSTGQSI